MNSSGHSNPTYRQSMSAWAGVFFLRNVATASDAGLRDERFFSRNFSVSPESRMSSETMTC